MRLRSHYHYPARSICHCVYTFIIGQFHLNIALDSVLRTKALLSSDISIGMHTAAISFSSL